METTLSADVEAVCPKGGQPGGPVLLVGENSQRATEITRLLDECQCGCRGQCLHSPYERGLEDVVRLKPAVVLLDLDETREGGGLAAIPAYLALSPAVPLIVLGQRGDAASAVAALRAGAQDFLVPDDLDADRLCRALFYAVERQRMERILRKSEERLALAIDGADLGLWDWNVTNDHIHIRGEWERLLGVRCEAAPPTFADWAPWIHPDDLPRLLEARELHAERDDRIWDQEFRMRRHDGSWSWFQVRGRVVERQENGMPLRLAGIFQDVSWRKTAEEQRTQALQQVRDTRESLIQAEKLAALGGLVAGIAHEINTPIGIGTTGASHLRNQILQLQTAWRSGTMKKSDFEKFISSADETSQIILSNLNRAAELVRSFKQIAVDQTGNQRRVIDVRSYIDEILLSLRPRLKKTPHVIDIECAEGVRMNSYPGAFSRILTNLVINSLVHAFPEGFKGTIRIVVTVSEGKLTLVYSDDGAGIEERNMTRIFEPFFTTRRNSGGSGLGLNIIHTLVTQVLAGEIKVQSQVGKGTTFTLSMPLTSPELPDCNDPAFG